MLKSDVTVTEGKGLSLLPKQDLLLLLPVFFSCQYPFFWLCVWRFINQLCCHTQAVFAQAPLLPSSLFPDLIEKFSLEGWKNSTCLMCFHPSHRPSLLCFVPRSLSVLFVFLGSNPFPAAVFRSALPVLFSERPSNKTGSRGEVWLCFRAPRITPNCLGAGLLCLVRLSGVNFYFCSVCSTFSNYLSLQLHYFSSYQGSIKMELIIPNAIFCPGTGNVFYFSALRGMEKLTEAVFLTWCLLGLQNL